MENFFKYTYALYESINVFTNWMKNDFVSTNFNSDIYKTLIKYFKFTQQDIMNLEFQLICMMRIILL
ncbi:MAG: hypothetical protein U0T83_02780 [Bacteriovoracaceae bacterium]